MMNKVEAPHGIRNGKQFLFPIRIYYEDTDAGGIVYYANYLKFAERARTEFLRYLSGVNQQEILEHEACGFVVRHLEIDYKSPAILDDFLTVSCEVVEAKGASVAMKQYVRRDEEILAEIDVKLAYVSLLKKRPMRIPQTLLDCF